MKRNLVRLLVITVLIGLFFSSCRRPKDEPKKPEEKTITSLLKEKAITVKLPADVDTKIISKLRVSNAYGTYKLTKEEVGGSSQKVKSSNPLDTYGAQINYTSTGLILTNIINEAGDMMMCSIYDPEASIRVTEIDAEKTAIALLMTHPILITSDKQEFKEMTEYIKKMPEFIDYRKRVETAMNEGLRKNQAPDYSKIYTGRIITALFNKSFENGSTSPSLMQVEDMKKENGKFIFNVSNDHKRVLHIYPKRAYYKPNGIVPDRQEYLDIALKDNQFVYQPPMASHRDSYFRALLTSAKLVPKSADYWQIVGRSLKGDRSSPFYAKTKNPIIADIGDADKLELEVYGIGKFTQPWDKYTEEQKKRIILVAIHGGYNDFMLPLFSLITGFDKLAQSSGMDNFKYDFRRGSKKAPLMELLGNLAQNFNGKTEFATHILKKEYIDAVYQLAMYSADQILGNRNEGTGQTPYLNNVYDIMKDAVGVSKMSKKFRDGVKSMQNQWSHVIKANFINKVIKTSEAGLDIGGAIYSYYNTDIVYTFRFDRKEEPYIKLLTPTSSKIFEKKGNIEFSWHLYRNGWVGAVKYDLIINRMNKQGENGRVCKKNRHSTRNTKFQS